MICQSIEVRYFQGLETGRPKNEMKEVMYAFENWHTAGLSLCFAMAAFRSATAIAKLSRVELLGRKRRAEAPSWHTSATTAGFKKEPIFCFTTKNEMTLKHIKKGW